MVPVRRHARHWLAYLAGGGLVLVAYLVGKQQPHPNKHKANSRHDQDDRIQEERDLDAAGQVKVGAREGASEESKAKGHEAGSDDRRKNAKNFLGRLTINERLTFFVAAGSLVAGAGSLIVSYFTYENSLDTSDIKNAVANLSALASYSKTQISTAQDAYVASTRAWVDVAPNDQSLSVTWAPGNGVTLAGSTQSKNYGTSPDISSVIGTALYLYLTPMDLTKIATQACTGIAVKAVGEIGFPDKSLSSAFSVTIDAKTFETFWKGLWGSKSEPSPGTAVGLALGLCVKYRITSDNLWHHTGTAFQLGEKAAAVGTPPVAIVRTGRNIAVGGLRSFQISAGDYAD